MVSAVRKGSSIFEDGARRSKPVTQAVKHHQQANFQTLPKPNEEETDEDDDDDYRDVSENSETTAKGEGVEDDSEEGMRRLMELVGEEGLNDFEKAQLALDGDGDDEDEDQVEGEEVEEGEDGSLVDGDEEEHEDEEEDSGDEDQDEEVEEGDTEADDKDQVRCLLFLFRPLRLLLLSAETGRLQSVCPCIWSGSRCHTSRRHGFRSLAG